MERGGVHFHSARKPKNNPGSTSRKKQETYQPQPNRGETIKHSYYSIVMAKCERRRSQKTSGQNDGRNRQPRLVSFRMGRKYPSLVQEKMRQKQNALKNGQEPREAAES